MKHTLKKLSDTRVSVTVTADADEINAAKHAAVKELGRAVKVQGFRKGKVPAAVIEKNIDPNALGTETVEHAINLTLNKVIDLEELRVLDQPKIELTKFVPFDTLEYSAEIEILPSVTLGKYTKLGVKKSPAKVQKADIDEVIERMQQGFADKNEVERASKDGDEVVIDFVGTDEKGATIDGASGSDYALRLGSNTFIPGFEEQLVGHKAGETFDIHVTFPDNYHAEHLKSAKVTFAITLKKVQEVTLPKVDDELAKKVGPFDTVTALRTDIERELTAQQDRQALEKLKDDLLGKVVESSTVPVPELLVDDQLRALEQDAMQNLMYRGQTLEQYLEATGHTDRDDWVAKELRPAAERRVKAGLVIAELSKAEKIEISKDELEAELTKRKAEAPAMAEQLDTPEARRDLANRVITEKTINRLVELNS
jgi:trigger factor